MVLSLGKAVKMEHEADLSGWPFHNDLLLFTDAAQNILY